jgi:hypothetical protein
MKAESSGGGTNQLTFSNSDGGSATGGMMDAHENIPADKVGLVRLTSWATAATVAITVAALASLSATGSQRLDAAVASLTGGEARQLTAELAARSTEVEAERRRLNEAIRLLASDRDRLLTRVGSIERNLDDITGSISRQSAPPRAMPESSSLQPDKTEAAPEQAPPAVAATQRRRPADLPPWLANAPEPWPSPTVATEIAPPPPPAPTPPARLAAIPAEAPPPPPSATRTEFGVDIGSGSNMDEVKALWNAAKAHHGRLIGNLRPIVAMREDRTGAVDMRLIVGPLTNAGAAAKLCASLGAADVMCSTRPYEGQRLAP